MSWNKFVFLRLVFCFVFLFPLAQHAAVSVTMKQQQISNNTSGSRKGTKRPATSSSLVSEEKAPKRDSNGRFQRVSLPLRTTAPAAAALGSSSSASSSSLFLQCKVCHIRIPTTGNKDCCRLADTSLVHKHCKSQLHDAFIHSCKEANQNLPTAKLNAQQIKEIEISAKKATPLEEKKTDICFFNKYGYVLIKNGNKAIAAATTGGLPKKVKETMMLFVRSSKLCKRDSKTTTV